MIGEAFALGVLAGSLLAALLFAGLSALEPRIVARLDKLAARLRGPDDGHRNVVRVEFGTLESRWAIEAIDQESVTRRGEEKMTLVQAHAPLSIADAAKMARLALEDCRE